MSLWRSASSVLAVHTLCNNIFTAEENAVCSPFGSHVLEQLLLQVQEALKTAGRAVAYQIIDQIVQLVKDDVVDYITHKFGTFFARRLLQLLIGHLSAATVSNPDSGGKKQDIQQKINSVRSRAVCALNSSTNTAQQDELVDARFRVHIDAFVNVFAGAGFDGDSIYNLQRSSYGSPFLQLLLNAPVTVYVSGSVMTKSALQISGRGMRS